MVPEPLPKNILLVRVLGSRRVHSLVDADGLAPARPRELGDGVGAVAVKLGGVRRVLIPGGSGGSGGW